MRNPVVFKKMHDDFVPKLLRQRHPGGRHSGTWWDMDLSLPGTFREPSVNLPGTFRENLGGTLIFLAAALVRKTIDSTHGLITFGATRSC